MGERLRIAFVYLGRRGALGRFTFELGQAVMGAENLDAELIISNNNEIASDFEALDLPVTLVLTIGRQLLTPIAHGSSAGSHNAAPRKRSACRGASGLTIQIGPLNVLTYTDGEAMPRFDQSKRNTAMQLP